MSGTGNCPLYFEQNKENQIRIEQQEKAKREQEEREQQERERRENEIKQQGRMK
jgi:hypothetical protein